MNTIFLVGGARPNFMKLAPLVRALDRVVTTVRYRIVHTGQHYDREMSDVFFQELGIPHPDFHLNAGGGSHATQTAKTMIAFESLCQRERPDAVVVVGDVNSTLACSIVAKKLHIPVAHVEAGLRSGDMRMPEEINRVVTDSIADWFFVTEPSARDNLINEGRPEEKIHFVGHVMADNVLYQAERLALADLKSFETDAFRRKHARYGVITLHRPSNVDTADALQRLAGPLRDISERLPLAFPMHPRTHANINAFGVDFGPNIELMPPQGYMAFLHLWRNAAVVLTDSGGLQEETTVLGVPCVTLRDTTERPVTVSEGTNILAGTDPASIVALTADAIEGRHKRGRRPALWDGCAAQRCVDVLLRELSPRTDR